MKHQSNLRKMLGVVSQAPYTVLNSPEIVEELDHIIRLRKTPDALKSELVSFQRALASAEVSDFSLKLLCGLLELQANSREIPTGYDDLVSVTSSGRRWCG